MAPTAKWSKSTLIQAVEEAFLSGWKLVLAGAILGFLIAVLKLHGAVYVYPVQMQVTAAQNNNADSNSTSRFSQLSGLASLANISLPTTQNAMQFQLYMDSFYTRDLANELAKNQDLMRTLYSGQWDPVGQSWREPPQALSTRIQQGIRNLLGLAPAAPWQPPGGANIQSFLTDNLAVFQDPRKPYKATLTLNSANKVFAINFLNILSKTADNRLRLQSLARSRDYINYLTEKLATVTVAETRMAMTQALGEQERYAMVASSSRPFAAEVFESPWASNLPYSPSPRLVFLIWVTLGGIAGLAISYLWRNHHSHIPQWLRAIPLIKKLGLT